MESNMVERTWAEANCKIVELFFIENFPQFSISNKYAYSPYWEITLVYQEIKVTIGGDIGFSVDVFIEDSGYAIYQYDKSVVEKMKTTDDNILYQLNVLKRFLNDVGY
jgi:hypothetical protein